MNRILLAAALALMASTAQAQFYGNEFAGLLSQVSAWKGDIPVDPNAFPYVLPFRIYERDQPVVAFEWLAGPLEPVPGVNRTYTLGNRLLNAANAASQGVDWPSLEDIFRHANNYRFFSPTAEPGLLNARDYFITFGPNNPENANYARFLPSSLSSIQLNVYGNDRNDPDQSHWVFWAVADGQFTPVPEPATIGLAGLAACAFFLGRRQRSLGG